MESVVISKSKFQISERIRERIVIGVRWLCMALFIYTAYAKTVNHFHFLNGLTREHIIHGYAHLISYLVPILEAMVSILLLIPKTAKIGLYCFLGTMVTFTGYIIIALIWETRLPCHCGGVIESLSWTQHIWFNLVFIGLACVAIWLPKSKNI